MKLALGLPIVESVPGEAVGAFMALAVEMSRAGTGLALIPYINVFPHSRVRELIVRQALELKCDRLFFVDSDIVVPSGGFGKLMEAMTLHHADFVSGHYYQRTPPHLCVWAAKLSEGFGYVDAPPSENPVELYATGLGCGLLDLHKINKYPRPLFEMQTIGERIIWEDAFFCQRVHQVGGKILGHPGVRCLHLGHKAPVGDGNVEFLRTHPLVV
jgi:hypothetical protein